MAKNDRIDQGNSALTFESFPLEIYASILRCSTPEGVYATIRASPKSLHAFSTFRERILLDALQNRLPQKIFNEILGLLRVPTYDDFVVEGNTSILSNLAQIDKFEAEKGMRRHKWNKWSASLPSLFSKHFRLANTSYNAYNLPSPRGGVESFKIEVNYMVNVYGMLKRFLRDYPSFVNGVTAGYLPPHSNLDATFERYEGPDYSPNSTILGPIEEERLQRAFLRYELTCQMVGIASIAAPNDTPIAPDAQQYKKLDLMRVLRAVLVPHEVEEIICISTYVRSQYTNIFNFRLRNLLQKISQVVSRSQRNSGSQSPKVCAMELIKHAGQIRDPYHFTLTEDWLQSMLRLGLPFLQVAMRSSLEHQNLLPSLGLFQDHRWKHDLIGGGQFLHSPGTHIGHCQHDYHESSLPNFAFSYFSQLHQELHDRLGRDECEKSINHLRRLGWVFREASQALDKPWSQNNMRNAKRHFFRMFIASSEYFQPTLDAPQAAELGLFVPANAWNQYICPEYKNEEVINRDFFLQKCKDVSGFQSRVVPRPDTEPEVSDFERSEASDLAKDKVCEVRDSTRSSQGQTSQGHARDTRHWRT